MPLSETDHGKLDRITMLLKDLVQALNRVADALERQEQENDGD